MPDDTPTINVPLPDWADGLIDAALQRHAINCPLWDRVRKLEIRFAVLVAFMLGSGFVGGAIGSLLSKVI